MRKILVGLFTLAILLSSLTGATLVYSVEMPKMELDPNPPIPGQSVMALYTQTATVSYYAWYAFNESDVIFTDGVATGIKTEADWVAANIPQYGQTVNLPANSIDKYLIVVASAADYSAIQTSVIAKINGVVRMDFDIATPIVGSEIKALYTLTETPANFYWYALPESDMEMYNGVAYKAKTTANWASAALPLYSQTITIPSNASGKYLYSVAARSDYSTIQASKFIKVLGAAPTMPPAPPMPTKKKTFIGFENVDNGVNIAISGSDKGPTSIRRANGEIWNPNAGPWASTEYSTFTDLFRLNSITDVSAPQGTKVGKWINKQGLSVPSGKGEWTGLIFNSFLDDPKNTYFVGATEMQFWLDTSNYVVPNDGTGNERTNTFTARPNVQVYDESGNPASNYCTYMPKENVSMVYYKDGSGEWIGSQCDAYGWFHIPKNYKGYVRLPIADYYPAPWTSAGSPAIMQLNNVIQLSFYLYSFAGEGVTDSYALLDDFSFAGNEMKDMPLNYYNTRIPEDGLISSFGIIDESSYVGTIGGTKMNLSWDSIGAYSKSYYVNLYKLTNAADEIGEFVKTFDGLIGTGAELTGLSKNTLYAVQLYAKNQAGEVIAAYDYNTFTTTGASDAVSGDDTSTDDTPSPTNGDSSNVIYLLILIALGSSILFIKKRSVISK